MKGIVGIFSIVKISHEEDSIHLSTAFPTFNLRNKRRTDRYGINGKEMKSLKIRMIARNRLFSTERESNLFAEDRMKTILAS